MSMRRCQSVETCIFHGNLQDENTKNLFKQALQARRSPMSMCRNKSAEFGNLQDENTVCDALSVVDQARRSPMSMLRNKSAEFGNLQDENTVCDALSVVDQARKSPMSMRRNKSAEFGNLQDENTKNLFKEARQFQEAQKENIIKIIDSCKQLSTNTQTLLGPRGSHKRVYKLFLNELVYKRPAPKVLVLAAKEQQKEFGDGANLVVSIAGKHLEGAKELIRMGLKRSEIINGYKKASNKLGEILEDLVEKGSETMDVRNKDEVILRLKDPVCCETYGMEDILCSLIAEACIQVCPKNPLNFNVDDVRVAKLLGVNLDASKTFRGMVLKVDTIVGSIKTIENAKVLVVAGGVDTAGTKTRRVYTDGQHEIYAQTEEAKGILHSGAKVIVSGAGVGRMAHQFCNVNKIMVLKITSQNELDCFCRTTDAVALSELKSSVVDPSYLGKVDSISVEKTLGDRVTVTKEQGCVATVLLGLERPDNIYYEQLERAVVKGVKIYKALCKDSRIVPGAGATEMEIAERLKEFSLKQNGSSSDATAIAKYAESFELIPKTLAKNSYLDVEDIMKNLKADHDAGKVKVGIDVKEGACKDASTLKIWDLYTTKYHALRYAADAVCDALSVVDQDPEPQSMFDRQLMAKHHVSGESVWQHELSTDKIVSIFYQSIWTNNLQPKGEVEMLAVKIHRDKLFGLSPDGTLSSFDIPSSEVCWSIPVVRELDLDFSFKSSQSYCSYFVDSSRVFMHTKEKKPVGLCHHSFEFFEEPFKYYDEEVTPSRLVTEIYVDPVKGRSISPVRSECEEILCIRAIHGQLTSYEPGTNNVLWYERVATFYIWIVSRDEGVKLQNQQKLHRSRRREAWAVFESEYVRL